MIRARLTRLVLASGLAVAALSSAPAAQADQWERLPAPTRLQALHVSDTAADLSWLSSALGDGDVLQRKVNGHWREWARGLFSFKALTELQPGTTYTVRVYTLGSPALWTLTSPPSEPLSFTTLAGPDAEPPAKPAAPTFSNTGTSSTTVFWPQTTDNVKVTGYYLDQLVGDTWTTVRTTDASQRQQGIGGLSPASTYTFGVRAFDARGNVSARSEPASVTTRPLTEQPTCDVQLTTFGTGFLASISVLNSTTSTFTGWAITANLDASVLVTSTFGAAPSRSGNVLTLGPVLWNTTIGPGGGVSAGFQGSSAQNLLPSGFAFNGIACSIH